MYKYEAIDAKGHRQKGVVEIEEASAALNFIRANYGMVLHLERVESKKQRSIAYSDRERAYFFKELFAVLQSGLPLAQGLEMLAQGKDDKLVSVIKELLAGINNGKSLYSAMAAVPEFFTDICLVLVRAGELSGSLAQMCLELGNYFQQKDKFQNEFEKIIAYPTLVFIVGVGVFFLFLFVVLPAVASMYGSLKAPLGGILGIMLALGDFLRIWWPATFILFLLVIFLAYSKRETLKECLWKLPYLRDIHQQEGEIRFCKILRLLLNGGVNIIEAINSAALALPSGAKYMQIQHLKKQLALGEDLGDILGNNPQILSPIFRGFIIVGTRTGALTALLGDAIGIEEEKFQRRLDKLKEFLPPLLLLLVALFIGFVVISVMQPIFNLFDALPMY